MGTSAIHFSHSRLWHPAGTPSPNEDYNAPNQQGWGVLRPSTRRLLLGVVPDTLSAASRTGNHFASAS